jgi:hypothetical protein
LTPVIAALTLRDSRAVDAHAHDADHLARRLRKRPAGADRHGVSDRAGTAQEFPGERLVHEDDRRRTLPITEADIAASDEGCAERRKPAGRDRIEVRGALPLVQRDSAGDVDAVVPGVAAHGRDERHRRRGDAGHGEHCLADAAVGVEPVGGRNLGPLRVDVHEQHAIAIEPEMQVRERAERSHEQSGRDDEDQRQGHLRDH